MEFIFDNCLSSFLLLQRCWPAFILQVPQYFQPLSIFWIITYIAITPGKSLAILC